MKIRLFFLFISITLALPQRVRLLFHGLGDTCEGNSFTRYFNAECIETGSGLWSYYKLEDQALLGCQIIKRYLRLNFDLFSNGVYLIGMSQGGLVARWIYKHCDKKDPTLPLLRPLVKGILTLGTPNLGIDHLPENFRPKVEQSIPENQKDNPIMGYLKGLIYSKGNEIGSSSVLSPFVYVNQFNENRNDKYPSNFIYDLLQDDYRELDFFLTLTFNSDKMVTPLSSTSFGNESIIDSMNKPIFESFTNTGFYKKNILGLKNLYDEGRFFNCRIPGGHLHLGEFGKYISNFLDNCSLDEFNQYDDCFKAILNYKFTVLLIPERKKKLLDILNCQHNFKYESFSIPKKIFSDNLKICSSFQIFDIKDRLGPCVSSVQITKKNNDIDLDIEDENENIESNEEKGINKITNTNFDEMKLAEEYFERLRKDELKKPIIQKINNEDVEKEEDLPVSNINSTPSQNQNSKNRGPQIFFQEIPKIIINDMIDKTKNQIPKKKKRIFDQILV
jgi:hypothetical protein